MAKQSAKKTLRERWTDDASATVSTLLRTRSIPSYEPRIEVDGRLYIDLRGFVIREPLKNQEIIGVDFSYCTTAWNGQFTFAKIKECRFESADIESNIGYQFSDCNFSKAILRNSVMRGTFSDCDFSNANLSSAGMTGGTFVRCRFVEANLKGAEFYSCRFEMCDFTDCKFGGGSFARSSFDKCKLDKTMLGDTIIDKAIFEKT